MSGFGVGLKFSFIEKWARTAIFTTTCRCLCCAPHSSPSLCTGYEGDQILDCMNVGQKWVGDLALSSVKAVEKTLDTWSKDPLHNLPTIAPLMEILEGKTRKEKLKGKCR